MKHSQGSFIGVRDLVIYFQSWQPEGPARAVILIAHGAAEHGGRYERFAQFFTERGYAVAALDHPGHGRSDGARCYVDSFEDYLHTLRLFHLRVASQFNTLPLFLLGHSMGGLISVDYLLEHQADFVGCILSGPAITTDIEPGLVQMWIIRLLAALFPGTGVLQLDASGVSRDPQEVALYRDDPLVFVGKLPARTVRELFRAMHKVQAEAGRITLPVLLLHGGEDAMASPEGSRLLEREISSTDKTLKIYPGLYHEIFSEPEREAIFAEVLAWCDAHLAVG